MSRKRGVNPEHYFSLCTGVLIKNIKELAFALEYISDEEYDHHVNHSKNDFSSWVRDVFGKKELAEKLLKTRDKKDMQIALFKDIMKKS